MLDKVCDRRLTPFLLAVVLLLTVLNMLAISVDYRDGPKTEVAGEADEMPQRMQLRGGIRNEMIESFERLFHFDTEGNIPAWFSSALLLIAAAFLWIIAGETADNGMDFVGHWRGLAILFVYISMDETAEIHEMGIKAVSQVVNARGVFYYAWVIPAIPLLLILLVLYRKFLFSLESGTRLRFIVAGSLFLFGALGLEMCSGYFDDTIGVNNPYHNVLLTLEDLFEMVGVVVFIDALMRYLRMSRQPTITARNESG